MDIDAVITWVNGADPAHRAKRMKYCPSDALKAEDKAGDTRYADYGEIFWCIASINRFAPWIRRIFIVTDEQDPCLDDFIKESFPERSIPMEIVDHKVIFRGYEEYLPTFNSISLETMTWRIPGLSDCFIEFNDDLMLLKPVSPEDFFTHDGKVICYGSRSLIPWDVLTRKLKYGARGLSKVTTKGTQINGARTAGHDIIYFRTAHSQKALRSDFYREYFTIHHNDLLKNISCRFRDVGQFSPQVFQYMKMYDAGKCELRNPRGDLYFFQPRAKKGYFKRKLNQLYNFKGRFACFNSIDQASAEERAELVAWIENLLGVKFCR